MMFFLYHVFSMRMYDQDNLIENCPDDKQQIHLIEVLQ